MDVAAGWNLKSFDALNQNPASQGISFSDRGAGLAADVIVVLQLQSLKPFGVTTDETNQLSGQLSLGIVSVGFVEHADPVGIQGLNLSCFR